MAYIGNIPAIFTNTSLLGNTTATATSTSPVMAITQSGSGYALDVIGLTNFHAANSSALTDVLINPTIKTSGNLLDLQIGGVSKFSVSYSGAVTGINGGTF